jgi:hypothetical protein
VTHTASASQSSDVHSSCCCAHQRLQQPRGCDTVYGQHRQRAAAALLPRHVSNSSGSCVRQ